MIQRKFIISLGVLVLALPAAADDGDGIHIPAGRSVGWNWQISDGSGHLWDITSQGQVNNGTNDCYDGGMRLSVNGNAFSWSSAGRLSADGREVEIGPWTVGTVRVWRRIYIDAKGGYCRWIDIFENTTNAVQSLRIQYYSNMGGATQVTWTTSGKTRLDKNDWGIVTGESNPSSSRPAVAHIFATRYSRLKPTFRWTQNNDNLYYDVTVPLGAKKTAALCFFEAQRRPFGSAKTFLKKFDVTNELKKIPAALRKLIVNMGSGMVVSFGTIELPRNNKHDLVVLRNGDEMLGTILNSQFVVDTFYGKLTFEAGKVLGLLVPSGTDPHVQVVLTDGQIAAGKLAGGDLKLKLDNGNEISLALTRVKTASFRVSPARPAKIDVNKPVVVLRSQQRLFFRPDDLEISFYTECGSLKLKSEHLRAILLDTPEGGLHMAVFTNGSTLSGLLEIDELNLKLDLGATLNIRRHVAAKFVFPSAKSDGNGSATLTLRNDNMLRGRLVGESYVVVTRGGDVTIRPDEISEITVPENSFERVSIKLHDGTIISGTLKGRTLRFNIDPGPKLELFVGHVKRFAAPPPATPDKPETDAKPAPTTSDVNIKTPMVRLPVSK